ncbi:S66 family peptidase [Paenibacillus gansuensis]|uniref:S66 peptidase family protein n=1 Tax=Paenibacillus gansuensis TaxID=306542 RepID=A0ABW5PES2_9BACL
MKRITYPNPLKPGHTIGITAPSSGVRPELHGVLDEAVQAVRSLGYNVAEGQALRISDKCVSAPKESRALELQRFMADPSVDAVIPPWGGEFLMEILPLIDWEALKAGEPKWMLGYSDISTILFVYTLLTGNATAHGTNLMDMRAGETGMVGWDQVLSVPAGGSILQHSSQLYQSRWDFQQPHFQLDTPTEWKILGERRSDVSFSGRLIGGCMDTLSILAGTRYAPVSAFVEQYCSDTGLIWYLESCEMNAADIYRHLWNFQQCGWFDHANGVLVGRPDGYADTQNFELKDALERIFLPMGIPVIYDADIGHVPPQLTLVNGAFAEVFCRQGSGIVNMTFR